MLRPRCVVASFNVTQAFTRVSNLIIAKIAQNVNILPKLCYNIGIMTNEIYDDVALEQNIAEKFGVHTEVGNVIARRIDVGKGAYATLFLSPKKQLCCYIDGAARLVLGDVRKIVARVGIKPELFFPPKGRPNYFDEIGLEKFKQVFPGRKDVGEHDLVFYRTLAPYCPALILVSEVKDGTIYCADSDAATGWRPSAKFAYRRIKTS